MNCRMNLMVPIYETRWMLSTDDLQNAVRIGKEGTRVYKLQKLERVALDRITDEFSVKSAPGLYNKKVNLSLYKGATIYVQDENGGYPLARVEAIYLRASALMKKSVCGDDVIVRVSWIYGYEDAQRCGVKSTADGVQIRRGSFYTSHHIQDLNPLCIEGNNDFITIDGEVKIS